MMPKNINQQIKIAQHLLCSRIEQIYQQSNSLFPLFKVKKENWILSKRGSWLAGFWCGIWHLKYHLSNSDSDKKIAQYLVEKINKLQLTDSINSSFIYYYGFVERDNFSIFDQEYLRLVVNNSKSFFNKTFFAFPNGTSLGGGSQGLFTLSIDSLAPLIGLSTLIQDSDYTQLVKQHTDTIVKNLIMSNGMVYQSALFIENQWTKNDHSIWQRGQAWGILGLIYAGLYIDKFYLSYAQLALDYWMKTFSLLEDTEDMSSYLIVIFSIFLMKEQAIFNQYQIYARKCLIKIIHKYVNDKTNHHNENGAFYSCMYEISYGNTALVEMIWADYFLLKILSMHIQEIKENNND